MKYWLNEFITPGFIIAFVVLVIHGCTANQDLEDIAKTKEECKNFKKNYDSVNPVEHTFLINQKIMTCKGAGAWDEVKK